jgi:hypothetical protein
MTTLKLQIKGWEDGERVDKMLEKPDRWQLHSADQVSGLTVCVSETWEHTSSIGIAAQQVWLEYSLCTNVGFDHTFLQLLVCCR